MNFISNLNFTIYGKAAPTTTLTDYTMSISNKITLKNRVTNPLV